METLEEEPQSTITLDRLIKNTNTSLPAEIIEEILSRLPVKSILRFRSVGKPWLSLISDPSFTKLQFDRATVSHRTALFISAYDSYNRRLYFLSAAREGGSVTHLLELDDVSQSDITEVQHSNGLVLLTIMNRSFKYIFLYVINPSTHENFKLPVPADSFTNISSRYVANRYLFGFDESRNEHKILNIRRLLGKNLPQTKVEIMIFSMSSYSWRKIDEELPIGCVWNHLIYDFQGGVCVNSVIYIKLLRSCEILAFDLRIERFFLISAPQGSVAPYKTRNGSINSNCRSYIMKINCCIGVVRRYHVVKRNVVSNGIGIWMLQDYENRVWVRESVKLPDVIWKEVDYHLPLGIDMDEIIISLRKVAKVVRNPVMSVPVYNMKGRRFKSLIFTLGSKFPVSSSVKFNQITCYVESILRL